MSDLPNFKELRHDPDHHLGLGDVRITIAQQDAIDAEIKSLKAALEEIAERDPLESISASIARAALEDSV